MEISDTAALLCLAGVIGAASALYLLLFCVGELRRIYMRMVQRK